MHPWKSGGGGRENFGGQGVVSNWRLRALRGMACESVGLRRERPHVGGDLKEGGEYWRRGGPCQGAKNKKGIVGLEEKSTS